MSTPVERIMGEFLDHHLLAAELQPFARRAGGGEQFQFAERKIPLFETKEHFHADGTRRANNRHMWLIHGSKAGISEPGRAA